MNAPSDIRQQLQRLQIPKDQRPIARRKTGAHPARWIALALVLLLLGGGVYAGRDRIARLINTSQPQADVKLMTVVARREQGPPPVLTATGKIVSDHLVQVATKVSGQIVALHFEQGDIVQQGQVIARVEDVNYRARRDQAKAMLEKARANLAYQQVNYERVRRLHEEAQSSDIEFHDAKRWYDDAVAQVAADEAALQYAQKALDDCEVVAPIAGVILERDVEVGDFVAAEAGRGAMANALFATIADTSKLRVEVDVSELDITRIRKDMPCVVTPDAYKDRKYPGYVMWLDPAANYSKATVQVKVRIENPDEYLRVSGSAQVAFLPVASPLVGGAVGERESAGIWIPKTACRINGDGKSGKVFVAADGKLRETPVTIGLQSANLIEITAGLAEGQTIAADGVDQLADGQSMTKS
jgi:HlyD family secretion protein